MWIMYALTSFLLASILIYVYTHDEKIYILNGELSSLPKQSIIKQIEIVSKIQCALRCRRTRECHHTAYQEDVKLCTLLRECKSQIKNFVIDFAEIDERRGKRSDTVKVYTSLKETGLKLLLYVWNVSPNLLTIAYLYQKRYLIGLS